MSRTVSNIYLDEYFIKKLNIEFTDGEEDFDKFNHEVTCERQCGMLDDHTYALKLIVNIKPTKETGYTISAEMDGFFIFPKDETDNDKMVYLAIENGAIMLYGILRGQVASVTGSFVTNKFVLPPVVMVAKEGKAKKIEENTKAIEAK